MRNPRTRSNKFGIFLLLFVGIIAFFSFYLSVRGVWKTFQAEFGAPADSLTIVQKIYFPLRLLQYREDLFKPMNFNNEPVHFEISYGETIDRIALRLEQGGLIPNREAWVHYLIYKGFDKTIQSGEYWIEPGSNAVQVAYQFQSAESKYVKFVILPGWRLEEIAASLPTSGLSISPAEFLEYTAYGYQGTHPSGSENLHTLEGFMFPGVYLLPRSASIGEVVSVFLNQFETAVTEDMRQNYQSQGLSLYQAVILASIVEKEAMIDEEKPLIASVFLNRLNVGMKLESDATVQYAIGYIEEGNTWWKNPLSKKDLNVDSVYNTYQYNGLPPTPICNPGIESLKAVAFPQKSTYLYFIARCDDSGYHNFSVTYEEHFGKICP